MEKIIHIALADDHKIYRDGIRMSLKIHEHIRIIWDAEDGKDMLHKLKMKLPDLLIMDINMPETDGIKALQLIRKEYEDLKVIILSMYNDSETVTRMMEYGANAYLTKTADAEEIYQAIITCINNEYYFNELVNSAVLLKLQRRKISKKFVSATVTLSEKELKVLKLMSEDKTTEEISEELFLSPRTVESIRQTMKTKVGVKTLVGLMMYAIKRNMIEW